MDTAGKIWADAVRDTGIWMAPYAEQVDGTEGCLHVHDERNCHRNSGRPRLAIGMAQPAGARSRTRALRFSLETPV